MGPGGLGVGDGEAGAGGTCCSCTFGSSVPPVGGVVLGGFSLKYTFGSSSSPTDGTVNGGCNSGQSTFQREDPSAPIPALSAVSSKWPHGLGVVVGGGACSLGLSGSSLPPTGGVEAFRLRSKHSSGSFILPLVVL